MAIRHGPLWNPEVETLDRAALSDLQWPLLGRQIRYVYDRSDFHRARFRQAGLTPDDIVDFASFAALPTMDKEDHRRAQQEALDRGLGAHALLACANDDEIVRFNATSGTTGLPTLYALTQHDVDVVNEMHARKYWRAGIRPGQAMLQALSLSMFTGGLPLSQGIMNLGAAVIPVGIEGGTKRVVEFARLTRPQALIATPSFGQHLIEECPKLTGGPASELGFRWFFCAGEPGGGEPETRTILAEGFGAKVFDHTGGGHAFHGISCDEPPGEFKGMHFVSEDHCLLELQDPETKAPIAIADGAVGEMIWTFLDWRGGPFLRYAMGDIVRIRTDPCTCGMPGLRFAIIGRADDMLIVKGVNIYPQAVKAVIDAFYPRTTGAFRIRLDRPGPKVTPPLKVRLEIADGLDEAGRADLDRQLQARFRADLRVSPHLEWVPAGTLPREAMKTRYVEVED